MDKSKNKDNLRAAGKKRLEEFRQKKQQKGGSVKSSSFALKELADGNSEPPVVADRGVAPHDNDLEQNSPGQITTVASYTSSLVGTLDPAVDPFKRIQSSKDDSPIPAGSKQTPSLQERNSVEYKSLEEPEPANLAESSCNSEAIAESIFLNHGYSAEGEINKGVIPVTTSYSTVSNVGDPNQIFQLEQSRNQNTSSHRLDNTSSNGSDMKYEQILLREDGGGIPTSVDKTAIALQDGGEEMLVTEITGLKSQLQTLVEEKELISSELGVKAKQQLLEASKVISLIAEVKAVQQKLTSVQKEKVQLAEEFTLSRKENRHLSSELLASQRQVVVANEGASLLSRDLELANQEMFDLNDKLSRQLQNMQQLLNDREESRQQLMEELTTSNKLFQGWKDEKTLLTDELGLLNNERHTLSQENLQLVIDLKSSKGSLQRLGEDLESTRRTLQQLHELVGEKSELVEAGRDSIEKLNALVNAKELELQVCRDQVRNLQAENMGLVNDLEEVGHHLDHSRGKETDAYADLEAQRQEFQAQLRQSQHEKLSLSGELEKSMLMCKMLNEEKSNLLANFEVTIDHLKEELRKMEEENMQQGGHLRESNQQVQKLSYEHEQDVKRTEIALDECKALVDSTADEKSKVVQELNAEKDQLLTLTKEKAQEVINLGYQLRECNDQVRTRVEENSSLVKILEESSCKLQKAVECASELKVELEKHKAVSDGLLGEKEILAAELLEIRSQWQTMKQIANDHELELERVTVNLQDLEEDHRKLSSELIVSTDEWSKVITSKTVVEREFMACREVMTKLEEQNSILVKLLEVSKSDLQRLSEDSVRSSSDLASELDKERVLSSRLVGEKERLGSELQLAIERWQYLELEMTQSGRQHMYELEGHRKQFQELQDKHSILSNDLTVSQNEVLKVKEVMAQSGSELMSELEAHRKQFKELQDNHSILSNELTASQNEMLKVKEVMAQSGSEHKSELQAHYKQFKELLDNYSILSKDLTASQNEILKVKEVMAQSESEHMFELEAHRKQLKELQDNHCILSNNLTASQNKMLKVKEMKDLSELELARSKELLRKLEDANKDLVGSLDEHRERLDVILDEKAKLLTDHVIELERLKEQQNEAEEIKVNQKEHLEQLLSDLEVLTIEKTGMDLELETFKEEYEKMGDENLKLASEFNKYKDEVQVLIEKEASAEAMLRSELEMSREMALKLKEGNTLLMIELEDHKERAQNLHELKVSEIENLHQQVQEVLQSEECTTTELAKVSELAEELKVARLSLLSNVEAMTQQLKRISKEKDVVLNDLEVSQRQLRELVEEKDDLVGKLVVASNTWQVEKSQLSRDLEVSLENQKLLRSDKAQVDSELAELILKAVTLEAHQVQLAVEVGVLKEFLESSEEQRARLVAQGERKDLQVQTLQEQKSHVDAHLRVEGEKLTVLNDQLLESTADLCAAKLRIEGLELKTDQLMVDYKASQTQVDLLTVQKAKLAEELKNGSLHVDVVKEEQMQLDHDHDDEHERQYLKGTSDVASVYAVVSAVQDRIAGQEGAEAVDAVVSSKLEGELKNIVSKLLFGTFIDPEETAKDLVQVGSSPSIILEVGILTLLKMSKDSALQIEELKQSHLLSAESERLLEKHAAEVVKLNPLLESVQETLQARERDLEILNAKVQDQAVMVARQSIEVEGLLLERQNLKKQVETANAEKVSLQVGLTQAEQKMLLTREKLSLAVNKGKVVVQQRDAWKLSVAEKSKELELLVVGHQQDLQVKDAALSNAEMKIADLTASVEQMVLLKAELDSVQKAISTAEQVFLENDDLVVSLCAVLNNPIIKDDWHVSELDNKILWMIGSVSKLLQELVERKEKVQTLMEHESALVSAVERSEAKVASLASEFYSLKHQKEDLVSRLEDGSSQLQLELIEMKEENAELATIIRQRDSDMAIQIHDKEELLQKLQEQAAEVIRFEIDMSSLQRKATEQEEELNSGIDSYSNLHTSLHTLFSNMIALYEVTSPGAVDIISTQSSLDYCKRLMKLLLDSHYMTVVKLKEILSQAYPLSHISGKATQDDLFESLDGRILSGEVSSDMIKTVKDAFANIEQHPISLQTLMQERERWAEEQNEKKILEMELTICRETEGFQQRTAELKKALENEAHIRMKLESDIEAVVARMKSITGDLVMEKSIDSEPSIPYNPQSSSHLESFSAVLIMNYDAVTHDMRELSRQNAWLAESQQTMTEKANSEHEVCEQLQQKLASRDLELSEVYKGLEESDLRMEKQKYTIQDFVEELHILKEELAKSRSEKDTLQTDLVQAEQKAATTREKLGLAIKKGKGLAQQRDLLKQSLLEQQLLVSNFKDELQNKESSLEKATYKVSLCREHVQALELNVSSLKDIVSTLEQHLQDKDNFTKRLEGVLAKYDFPSELQSREFPEKLEWLVTVVSNTQSSLIVAGQEVEALKKTAVQLSSELKDAHTRAELERESHAVLGSKLAESGHQLQQSQDRIAELETLLSDADGANKQTEFLSRKVFNLEELLQQKQVEVSKAEEVVIAWVERFKESEGYIEMSRERISELEGTVHEALGAQQKIEHAYDRILALEQAVLQKEAAVKAMESSRGKAVSKLTTTVSKFRELCQQSEGLVVELERMHGNLQFKDGEILQLKEEIGKMSGKIENLQEMLESKRIFQLHLEKLLDITALSGPVSESCQPMTEQDGADQLALRTPDEERCLASVTSLRNQVDSLTVQSQADTERNDLQLQDLRKEFQEIVVESIQLKVSLQREQLQSERLKAEVATMHSPFGEGGENQQELTEEVQVTKRLLPISSPAPHVRGARRPASLDVAIDMNTELNQSMVEFDDKGHGFKSLTSSRFMPRGTGAIGDQIDKLCVAGGRMLMRQPAVRLGVTMYWLAIHIWMAFLISAAHV